MDEAHEVKTVGDLMARLRGIDPETPIVGQFERDVVYSEWTSGTEEVDGPVFFYDFETRVVLEIKP